MVPGSPIVRGEAQAEVGMNFLNHDPAMSMETHFLCGRRWECGSVCMVYACTPMCKGVHSRTCLLSCCWGRVCRVAIGFWIFFPDKLSM